MHSLNHKYNHYQTGIALPLTLILLLAMTLIAVATLRTTTLEENMTANSRLRQIAFNTAEMAVREAESGIRDLTNELNRENRGIRNLIFSTDPVAGQVVPNTNAPGDTCSAGISRLTGSLGGFCTPAIQTFVPAGATAASLPPERWLDPALDVWNDDDKHIKINNLTGTGSTELGLEGVIEPPKYIVEFLGNYDYKELNTLGKGLRASGNGRIVRPVYAGAYVGQCRNATNNELTPPNDAWPYCAADASLFRITVRATAGPRARQAETILQSQFRVGG